VVVAGKVLPDGGGIGGRRPQTGLRKLNDDRKDEYLRLIGRGVGLLQAAEAVGVSSDLVRREARRDPVFAAEIEECRAFATEKIERVLYQKAEKGESWAVKEWLKGNAQDKYGTARSVSVHADVSFGGDEGAPLLERIAAMQVEVAGRRQALDVGAIERGPQSQAGQDEGGGSGEVEHEAEAGVPDLIGGQVREDRAGGEEQHVEQ